MREGRGRLMMMVTIGTMMRKGVMRRTRRGVRVRTRRYDFFFY